ncbi:MAG: response regulator transcription factor, partial [Saprospiraceae bacterium]|nr:response regulator transcription factor [Saprospiraceae bacterium]
RLKPDLVFLDIQMPEVNGFELLEIIGDINFRLIFTTAFDQYAVRAFKVSAVDYLLKPVDQKELKLAIEKVKKRGSAEPAKEYELLLKNIDQIKTIALKAQGEYRFFEVDEIMYLKADGNYCFLFRHKPQRQEHISYSLGKMEEMLPEHLFFRNHASFIINRNHIKKYSTKDGGYLVMRDGARLPVAKSRKTEFDNWMGFNDS